MEAIDLTQFGEGWVNTILDLRLAAKNIPENYPYSLFYLWSVKRDNEEDVVGVEWKGENADGLAYAFYKAFIYNKEIIPLIVAAIAKFVHGKKDPKRREAYKAAILQILDFEKQPKFV